ncbi:uncharacterized protein TRAVEDRAFT_48895 [Trametes versicolor FP-101664 SS1]|uniref:uncharacterized protein n=1 Tax=Trametes versicolor (strain FP-101664) TaxID=717944 RepID=UPI0004623030|nr:uncharacterized protein TRAVEDRAFT_48895 [Trametes versicolor FP-101664 SS1]EIW57869.1 hypothetical protein TRAVEDRAFT_48895 [Trametes versicolor FP-101664 SS1]
MALLPNTTTSNVPTDVVAVPAALVDAIQDNMETTFGAYLVCTCLGCIMFGLTTHQTYRYFRLYPTDMTALKVLVLTVLVLDITHTITSIHVCYFYLVTNYFHPERLLDGVWSIRLIILEMGVLILVCHLFFARRLFLLGNRNLIPVVIIGLLLLLEMGFCMAAVIESFLKVSFANFEKYPWLIWTILALAVAVDVVATSTLTYYLRQSRTGFKRTDSMVDILMVYGINTGLSTSVVTLAALISAIALPNSLIYTAIMVVGTKMYANSLLAVLNSRRSIVDRGMEGFETGSFGLKVVDPRDLQVEPREFHAISFKTPVSQKQRARPVLGVKVTTETFVDVDGHESRENAAVED